MTTASHIELGVWLPKTSQSVRLRCLNSVTKVVAILRVSTGKDETSEVSLCLHRGTFETAIYRTAYSINLTYRQQCRDVIR